jgi:hypothetical protein
MKKSILLVLIFFTLNSFSQDLESNLDHKNSPRLSGYYQDMRDYVGVGPSINYNYRHVSFYNPRFYELSKESLIKQTYGNEIDFSYNYYPIKVDVCWFATFFEVSNFVSTYLTNTNYSTRHRGAEFFLSYMPLPHIGKFSKHFMPYVGIGYQTSQLVTLDQSNKEKEVIVSSHPTGSISWKIGLCVNINSSYFINAEYKQTGNLSEPEAFNVWTLGIGVRYNQ